MKSLNKLKFVAGLFGVLALAGLLWAGDTGFHSIRLDSNTIKDSNGTTRISVGSTNALTGNVTISGSLTTSGTSYFTIQQSTAPRSTTVGLTPTSVGQFVYNSTDNELCVSTGITKFTWMNISSTTARVPCSH